MTLEWIGLFGVVAVTVSVWAVIESFRQVRAAESRGEGRAADLPGFASVRFGDMEVTFEPRDPGQRTELLVGGATQSVSIGSAHQPCVVHVRHLTHDTPRGPQPDAIASSGNEPQGA